MKPTLVNKLALCCILGVALLPDYSLLFEIPYCSSSATAWLKYSNILIKALQVALHLLDVVATTV